MQGPVLFPTTKLSSNQIGHDSVHLGAYDVDAILAIVPLVLGSLLGILREDVRHLGVSQLAHVQVLGDSPLSLFSATCTLASDESSFNLLSKGIHSPLLLVLHSLGLGYQLFEKLQVLFRDSLRLRDHYAHLHAIFVRDHHQKGTFMLYEPPAPVTPVGLRWAICLVA